MIDCTIKALTSSIHSSAILKFKSKMASIDNNGDEVEIAIEEDDKSTRLKKLTIKATKPALDGEHPKNGILIALDHKKEDNEKLSKLTHFTRDDIAGLASKCDFVIFYKKNDNLNVIVSDMKSSKPNSQQCIERVERQFNSSRIFTEYLIKICSAVHSTKNSINNIKFYEAIFLPRPSYATEPTEPLTPEETEKLHSDRKNYIEVVVNEHGEACIGWASLINQVP